jgi:hypothetical protein
MITNKGKTIIGKYLLGQAPAFASYIAVGCGTKALTPYVSGTLPDYSATTELEFEMFRVPITSRGFVDVDGESKMVLTAELPTEERYEITEIGVYSSGSNSLVGSADSKNIFAFTSTEDWKVGVSSTMPTITEPLDDPLLPNIIKDTISSVNTTIFKTNADNSLFGNSNRISRNERSRFLNNTILMRGDSSSFTTSNGNLVPSGAFIGLSNTSADFSKNAPTDELRFAFSVVNKNGTDPDITNKIAAKVVIEFSSSTNSGEYARMEAIVNHVSTSGSQYNFNTNRYFVVKKKLEELNITNNFSWKSVDTVKIYGEVLTGTSSANTQSANYYIALDALRLENKNQENPLYGLTGYSIVRTVGGLPIIKGSNTSNYIEFRFGLDVS